MLVSAARSALARAREELQAGEEPGDLVERVESELAAARGARLRRAIMDYARKQDVAVARWIEDEVPFPRTMVDSITPATDTALRDRVAERLGTVDRWPVQREAFTQWVIEDCMRGPQPDWAAIGVTWGIGTAGELHEAGADRGRRR